MEPQTDHWLLFHTRAASVFGMWRLFAPMLIFLFLSLLNSRPLRTGHPSTRYPGRILGRCSSGRRGDPIDAEPNDEWAD